MRDYKAIKKILTWGFLYALVLFPFVITILFSVASADDFSTACGVLKYGNILSGAVNNTIYFYKSWSGDLVITFLQHIFNPIVYFKPSGYALGIFLLLVFFGFIISLFYYIKAILFEILGIDNNNLIHFIHLLFLAAFLNTEIYSETFYWYVSNTYLWGYIFHILLQIGIIRFLKKEEASIKDIVLLSILGFLVCTGYQEDVFSGIVFLLGLVLVKANWSVRIKKCIPLFFMILGGCLSCFSPGNMRRHDAIDSTGLHLKAAILTSTQHTIGFTFSALSSPLVIFAIILFFTIGLQYKCTRKMCSPVVFVVAQLVSTFGILFPIALGYSSAEVPLRMVFVVNLTICLWIMYNSIYAGSWVTSKYPDLGGHLLRRDILVAIGVVVLLVGMMRYTPTGRQDFYNLPWTKTAMNIENVAYEGMYYKNNVYGAIEKSEEEDVIIQSYSGEVTHILYTPRLVESDYWVNGAVAVYYKKKSITSVKE